MAQIDATVVRQYAPTSSSSIPLLGEETARDVGQVNASAPMFMTDSNLLRAPDYWLYVFNIAPVSHTRHRPPQFTKMEFAACPPDKEWVLVAKFPNIIQEKWISPETGQLAYHGTPGERFVTDLINPGNLTNNMWAPDNPDTSWLDSGTDDLSRRGVFWSRNAVPTPAELGYAKARMEKHYRTVVQQGDQLFRDPKRMMELGEEHHRAATYLGINNAWHVQTEVNVRCPNCGDSIKPGIAYHASSVGGICVLDWKRSVQAGVKSRTDVPPELRWWAEDTLGPEPKPKPKGN